MVTGSSIRAGRAFVELLGDDSQLQETLKRVRAKMKATGAAISALGARIGAVGGAITAPFAVAARQFAQFGDDLNKMAARTGVSVEALSGLKFAAEQSGAGITELEAGLRGMQRSINDLGRGLSTQKDAFGALGLAFEDLSGLSPEKQFSSIAEAISRVDDPTQKAALAMQIFGRAGQRLIPLLSGGAIALEQFQREAEELGIIMSTEDAASAAEFTDALNRMRRVLQFVIVQVGGALAPALTDLANTLASASRTAIEWVQNNKGLIVTVAAIGAGLLILGGILTAIGLSISAIGAVIGIASTAFSLLGAALGALLSPLGLVITLVAGMGAAWALATEDGKEAVSFLGDRFKALSSFSKSTFGLIAKLLGQGKIGEAAKFLWATIKFAFVQGKTFILSIWEGFISGLIGHWFDLVANLKSIWAGFTAFYDRTVLTIADKFAEISLRIQSFFDDSLNLDESLASLKRQTASESKEIEARTRRKRKEILEERALREQARKDDLKGRLDAINKEKDASKRAFEQARSDAELSLDQGDDPSKPGSATDLVNKFDNILGQIKGVSSGSLARGTFSGAAAEQALSGGVGGTAEELRKQTNALDRVNTQLEDIETNTRNSSNSSSTTFGS